MNVDWGQAFQVGGFGFFLVFLVLAILAISMWLIGWVFDKSPNIKNIFKREKKTQSSFEDNVNKSEVEENPEYEPKFTIDDSNRYE